MGLNYFYVLLALLISLALGFIISMASYLLGSKSPDKEKVSVYECGFDPFHAPGEPFSIRFFLIGILFLVFDLEITYLFPWAMSSNIINLEGQLVVVIFLIVLTAGLVYEWVRGGLDWE
jgi:NADH:ubiquinone oxidoreductase subunit 3 (subunit A)